MMGLIHGCYETLIGSTVAWYQMTLLIAITLACRYFFFMSISQSATTSEPRPIATLGYGTKPRAHSAPTAILTIPVLTRQRSNSEGELRQLRLTDREAERLSVYLSTFMQDYRILACTGIVDEQTGMVAMSIEVEKVTQEPIAAIDMIRLKVRLLNCMKGKTGRRKRAPSSNTFYE